MMSNEICHSIFSVKFTAKRTHCISKIFYCLACYYAALRHKCKYYAISDAPCFKIRQIERSAHFSMKESQDSSAFPRHLP